MGTVKWSTRADADLVDPRSVSRDIQPVDGTVQHYGGVGPFAKPDHDGCLQLWRNWQTMHLADETEDWVDIAYSLGSCWHRYVLEGRSTQADPIVRGGANGNRAINGSAYSIVALWGRDDGDPELDLLVALRAGIDFLRAEAGAADALSSHRDHQATACLPLDTTEVLSRRGWVRLGDVRPDDAVASWSLDSQLLTFDRPVRFVEPYEAETVVIDHFESTLDHNWVTYGQRAWAVGCECGFDGTPASIRSHVREGRRRGEWHRTLTEERWKLVPAADLPAGSRYPGALPAGSGPGLDMTDEQIRLIVWLQGDGHFMRDHRRASGEVYGVEWHLRKPRKIERLGELLGSMGIDYRTSDRSDGTISLRVYGDTARDRIIALLPDKRFTFDLLDMSPHQADVFMAELFHVDGCTAGSYYCSTDQTNLDVVQAVATLNGRIATRDGSKLRLYSGSSNSTWRRTVSRRAQGRRTMVGCLTTVNGTLVVRQNGRCVVIGNCPGDPLAEWIELGAPLPDAAAVLLPVVIDLGEWSPAPAAARLDGMTLTLDVPVELEQPDPPDPEPPEPSDPPDDGGDEDQDNDDEGDLTVPPRPSDGQFSPGTRHPSFAAMGERFLDWLDDDEIAHDGNGYQPGPTYTEFDDFNVRKIQALMSNAVDPVGRAYFGPLQWERLFEEGRPSGASLPDELTGRVPPQLRDDEPDEPQPPDDVPPVPDAEDFQPGKNASWVTAMGRRFKAWMRDDEIHKAGSVYTPGPNYSVYDDRNVRVIQALMGNRVDPEGEEFLGPLQWERLFEEGRPSGASVPASLKPGGGGGGADIPVEGNRITQHYGVPGSYAAGVHTGVDLGSNGDRTIRCVASGTVVSAGWAGEWGRRVVVRHGNGRWSWYCHLASISVKKGQHVGRGRKLGVMGDSGNANGVHLHYQESTGGFGYWDYKRPILLGFAGY